MNRIVKYLIIFFITLIVIVLIIYIDYFNVKTNNTNPKISIKIESENDILYKAIFYKVYYCKTNKKYKIAAYDEEIVCPNNYNYVEGYYTNREGLKISKKDLQLLTNDGIYTSEMIENMKNSKNIDNAVLVAKDFGSKKYKIVDEKDGYNVVIFPTFKEVEDNYDWIYDEDDKKYCLKGDNYNYQLANFDNDKCGKYEKITMSEEWCKLYNQSTLTYLKGIENLCK